MRPAPIPTILVLPSSWSPPLCDRSPRRDRRGNRRDCRSRFLEKRGATQSGRSSKGHRSLSQGCDISNACSWDPRLQNDPRVQMQNAKKKPFKVQDVGFDYFGMCSFFGRSLTSLMSRPGHDDADTVQYGARRLWWAAERPNEHLKSAGKLFFGKSLGREGIPVQKDMTDHAVTEVRSGVLWGPGEHLCVRCFHQTKHPPTPSTHTGAQDRCSCLLLMFLHYQLFSM